MEHFNIEDDTAVLLKNYGAFYAFSKAQFNDEKVEGKKYVKLTGGLIVPKDTVSKFLKAYQTLHDKKIKWELENNSIKDIVFYFLANFECQISGCYDYAIEFLEPYCITEQQINSLWPEYMNYCIENDLF